jgi:hypothetical protein
MRHIRLLFGPRDHIVIEYPLTSILMPHGPSHRFIVVRGGSGIGVGGATGEGDGGAAAGGPGIIEIDTMNSFGLWYVAYNTLCTKNE